MSAEIKKSVFSLAKTNNGFFKSQKQADFLIDQFKKYDDFIGYSEGIANSCPLFVKYDEKGIIEIYMHSNVTNKTTVKFQRAVVGELNEVQVKEIKSLERKVKSLQKELNEKVASFENGSYNRSGDVSTYTQSMIDLYNKSKGKLEGQIEAINNRIIDIKSK